MSSELRFPLSFPKELNRTILDFLPNKDLCSAGQACQTWFLIVSSDLKWGRIPQIVLKRLFAFDTLRSFRHHVYHLILRNNKFDEIPCINEESLYFVLNFNNRFFLESIKSEKLLCELQRKNKTVKYKFPTFNQEELGSVSVHIFAKWSLNKMDCLELRPVKIESASVVQPEFKKALDKLTSKVEKLATERNLIKASSEADHTSSAKRKYEEQNPELSKKLKNDTEMLNPKIADKMEVEDTQSMHSGSTISEEEGSRKPKSGSAASTQTFEEPLESELTDLEEGGKDEAVTYLPDEEWELQGST